MLSDKYWEITMSSDSNIVFKTRGLSKVYDMGEVKVHALRGVGLVLYEGELVVSLGAPGCGKSRRVNIIGGIVASSSGSVLYQHNGLPSATDRELTKSRRHYVLFVCQFYNLIPSLTAAENSAIVTEIAQNPIEPQEALELVGLGDRADSFPSQLSGGQQQRVAIARAIAKQPAVLLCDEPTGALDSETGIIVLEALQRVNRELGTTTVIITHNVVQGEMAERIIELKDGRITNIHRNEHKKEPHELTW